MKDRVCVLPATLLILAFTAASCASPQAYDIQDAGKPVAESRGIIVGRVVNMGVMGLNLQGEKPWNPWWMLMLGFGTRTMISVDGVSSEYAVDGDGYYAFTYEAGKLTDLKFAYETRGSSSSSGGSGSVTVSSSVNYQSGRVIPIASEEKPITVEAGKIVYAPIVLTRRGQDGFEDTVKDDRAQELRKWFEQEYPELYQRYAGD